MSDEPTTRRVAVDVPALPPVGAYSQAVVSSGRLLHVAGQVAVDAEGHSVGVDDPAAQAAQVVANLTTVLAAAGAVLGDVVSLRVFVTTSEAAGAWAALRTSAFDAPLPASTLVYVPALARPDWQIEVEAIADLGGT